MHKTDDSTLLIDDNKPSAYRDYIVDIGFVFWIEFSFARLDCQGAA